MSIWLLMVTCWVVASVPLAFLVGAVIAGGHPPVETDDLSGDVDELLERLFPVEAV